MKCVRLAAILSLSLSGCAFHQAPYITYEGTPALSETAVFAAFDERQPGSHANILAVDGKATTCVQAGCPAWVRVLPGQHDFTVRYSAHFELGVGTYNWKRADTVVTVPAMKAAHVYQTRYRESADKLSVTVDDLGEKPKFGITLGLEGVNKKFYPVEF
ncbi:hypothetical protein hmeg3_01785 [Herbaspirillum sp. meg3]|uniref:hypothetical protein n=1 Tax=Herbaspirillum sp. meg3 TaxID=2025949 RepID=UPI000B97F1F0|nr:hypothetical protein [Herbaspirillum sp. meg3]ASU37148.1 hypothetical protein hmeg3_01785 [Herbaspirillum sp. meg3]